MPKAILTPAARADVIDAHAWYQAVTPSLGDRFRDEIDTAIKHIESNPVMFPVVFQNLRRVLLQKFPYGLFFRATQEAVVVIACFHCSRNPRTWQRRG